MSTLDREFSVLFFDEVATELKKDIFALNLVFAEDLVIHCARSIDISPVFWHLFGLYQESGNVWLSPNQKLVEWFIRSDERSKHLQFRLRFKPASVEYLKVRRAIAGWRCTNVAAHFHNRRKTANASITTSTKSGMTFSTASTRRTRANCKTKFSGSLSPTYSDISCR